MARTNAKTSTSSEKETAKTPAAQPSKPASNAVAQPSTPAKAAPVAQAAATPARNTTLSHEQIARRAYEIFLARGGQHGHHEQDWHQAERELRLGRQ